MNFDLFKKMNNEIYLYEEKEEIKNYEDCEHIFKDIEGAETCIKCGIVERYNFDNIANHIHQKPNKQEIKQYTPKLHIKEIISRLSGFFFKEKISEEQIKNLLNLKKNKDIKTIKQVRQFIKNNKLCPKNDFYIYKLANNIQIKISYEDKQQFIKEYLKIHKDISNRDFLYQKFNENENYNVFAHLFKRKINKKKQNLNIV